jgi:oxygen-dependent protoporphyrinogen oxidase
VPRHVIVVGAGLAGLAAAYRLESLGCRVTVLEARGRPGGKHARESLSGLEYEPWPGGLPRSAPAFAELAHELDLGRLVARAPLRPPVRLRDVLRGSWLGPFRLRRLAIVTTWLGGALDPDVPWRDTRLDDRSVADFCQVYLGRRARDQVLEPLFAAVFGLASAEASRQLLFSFLEPTSELALDSLDGAGRVAEALAARLADLRTGARVAAVAPDRRGVELADGAALGADAVLLAVNAGEAERLSGALAPAARAGFAALRSQSSLVLTVVTPEEVTPRARETWLARSEGGELAAISARGPRLFSLAARPDLAARHGHRPDAELTHFLLESAARALPELADPRAATRLHRFPAQPAFAVGHYRALARIGPGYAGDWCSAPHVEGELASGLRAARELAASGSGEAERRPP